MRIPIAKPFFGQEEADAVLEPLRTGWVVQGPRVAEFERLFAEYSGSRHAVAATSCTASLHMALVALGIGPGDEVIVPAFTFVASANVIEHVGATSVLVDVDLDTFNIDVSQIEPRITERTRAIMPVSLFGLSADMDPILDIARRHHLNVIEDAACGIGARYHGHHAGTLADIGCISFHPRKAITTGEGGMALTQDDDVAGRLRALRNHGATVSDLARHEEERSYVMAEYPVAGFNYRMTDLQGALGVAQMGKLEYVMDRRRELARRYDERLAEIEWLATPDAPAGFEHGYQSYVCLFRPEEPSMKNVRALHELRNRLMGTLEKLGIATRQGTQALHIQRYYEERYGFRTEDYPRAHISDRLSLALPLYTEMTDEELDYVVRSLRSSHDG